MRAVIIDDERVARKLLRSHLEREPDVDVVGECASGSEAPELIRSTRPDLAFLDVQMPGMDGFQVLQQLEAGELPVVVFVTAFDEYAVRAFQVHALDYLLKPFDDERLRQALDRARKQMWLSNRRDKAEALSRFVQETASRAWPQDRIAVKDGEQTVILRAEEIDWIESESNYVRLHAGKRAYMARSTLRSLEETLDPYRFARVHRTAIVNADKILKLLPWSHGDMKITLQDGTELNLSRRYRDRLEKLVHRLR